jgi:hypothetical protein
VAITKLDEATPQELCDVLGVTDPCPQTQRALEGLRLLRVHVIEDQKQAFSTMRTGFSSPWMAIASIIIHKLDLQARNELGVIHPKWRLFA